MVSGLTCLPGRRGIFAIDAGCRPVLACLPLRLYLLVEPIAMRMQQAHIQCITQAPLEESCRRTSRRLPANPSMMIVIELPEEKPLRLTISCIMDEKVRCFAVLLLHHSRLTSRQASSLRWRWCDTRLLAAKPVSEKVSLLSLASTINVNVSMG